MIHQLGLLLRRSPQLTQWFYLAYFVITLKSPWISDHPTGTLDSHTSSSKASSFIMIQHCCVLHQRPAPLCSASHKLLTIWVEFLLSLSTNASCCCTAWWDFESSVRCIHYTNCPVKCHFNWDEVSWMLHTLCIHTRN